MFSLLQKATGLRVETQGRVYSSLCSVWAPGHNNFLWPYLSVQ